ncbi:MAG: hypothetical protein ACREBG_22200 [Pyrinomonadaceae bacterium]
MDQIGFDELWKGFISPEYKDSGFENVREIRNYLHRLPDHKRAAFLDELVSVAIAGKEGYGIALSVLESESMPQHVRVICEYVTRVLNDPMLQENDLVGFLRILASDKFGQCLAPVETYLLKRRIGPYWNSLPWALWPHQPELFARAQGRYFTTRPSDEWRHSVIPQAFLTRADALALVKQRLSEVSGNAWHELRNVLLKQLDAEWLNESDRKSLSEVLAS